MFQIRIVLLVSRDFLKAFVCTHPKDKGRLALLADRPSSFGFVHTKALRKSLLTSNSILLDYLETYSRFFAPPPAKSPWQQSLRKKHRIFETNIVRFREKSFSFLW